MTETNGVFKAVSPDPEQAYRESIEQLREEGMAPDELKFQFQCQQCGLRCCNGTSCGYCDVESTYGIMAYVETKTTHTTSKGGIRDREMGFKSLPRFFRPTKGETDRLR